MSYWVHIGGTIQVSAPFYSVSAGRIKDYIEWSISQCKKYGYKIEGSEGPAKFFVNVPNRPHLFASNNANTLCDGCITVYGSLRDSSNFTATRETNAFLRRLSHFLKVDEVSINIDDGDDKSLIDKTVYDIEYERLYENGDMTNDLTHKLFLLNLANSHRYYDQLLTLEKASEIAEFITHVSPKTLNGLLGNFGCDRTIDWDYTYDMKSWFANNKIPVDLPSKDSMHEQSDKWFKQRKYPRRLTAKELKNELCEKTYGDKSFENTVIEHNKNEAIYNIIKTALNNKIINEDDTV